MLQLAKLRFKGIGRFVDEQLIIFDNLGKLVQVDGKNNNTGGSSGAGKSTIFNAIDYLFGFNKIPSTVLRSRLSDDGIFVEGTFIFNGKPLTITRGKKLSIDLDGEVTTGSSSKSEEKLDEIIGMPRELFRKLLHKRQKEGGFFLQMTPKDVNDFLTSALGHSAIKSKIDIVDKKTKELTEKKTANITALTAARTGLKATQDAILSLGLAPVKDIHQSVIVDLKKKHDESSAKLSEILTAHKLELETLEISRPKVSMEPFDRSGIVTLESQIATVSRSIDEFKRAEASRLEKARKDLHNVQLEISKLKDLEYRGTVAVEKIKEISEQLKAIKQGKCFNCGNDWQDLQKEKKLQQDALKYRNDSVEGKKAAEAIPALEQRLKQLESEILPREIPEIKPLGEQLNALTTTLAEMRQNESKHNATQAALASEAQAKFSELTSKMRYQHSVQADQARGQADIDRRAFEAAVGKLKAYEEARTRYENSLASLKAQEVSYSNKVSELSETSTQIHNQLEMAEELKRALKSYLSCSFDEALESISENATRLIRFIPNMANATIQLEGIRETGDGKVKEEVNAVIHMDGEQNVDIRSLCGGERTATDLAIDLSVIDLLENKANKGIDLFILDEPFEGLDTVCIEMALEVLKNSNSNKRLVIVDHNPEVKEMVENRLVVVRDGATSRVEQG